MKRPRYIHKKLCIIIIILFLMTFTLLFQTNLVYYPRYPDYSDYRDVDEVQLEDITKWMERRNNNTSFSKLGRILFLGENPPLIDETKHYQILVWKHGPFLERRLLKHYSSDRVDPFAGCPVKNCDITYKEKDLKTADIVLFHLHKTKNTKELPSRRGNPDQIWAFLTEESPYHTFLYPDKNVNVKSFNGIFNWSMSYRMDSDIPIPYGRTILKKSLSQQELNIKKKRDVLVAIMASNCGGRNNRWAYIKELQKHIKVHVYGHCGTLKCPGHVSKDCSALDKYLFYLSFENSNCEGYITEKVWWNAFHKNSIPIVMGASHSSYRKILPPNSYINVDDFANPASLASFLLRLNSTNEFFDYYRWKTRFDVLNEHGYFQSPIFHYCRVCQALNFNTKKQKIYLNLEKDYGVRNNCRPAWNS